MKAPNTCTGGFGVSISEANPAEVVSEVYSIGRHSSRITPEITLKRSAPGL